MHIEIYPERKAIYHNGQLLHGASDWTADKDDAGIALEAYVAREERLPYEPPEGTSWDSLIDEVPPRTSGVASTRRGLIWCAPNFPLGSFQNFEQEAE